MKLIVKLIYKTWQSHLLCSFFFLKLIYFLQKIPNQTENKKGKKRIERYAQTNYNKLIIRTLRILKVIIIIITFHFI